MARERLLTTSAKKKEQGRPSAAHLWLRRSRRFVGPALFGSAILMGFGLIAYGIAAVDPASQARRMLDTVAVFGSDRSMTVQAVIVDGRQNTPLPLIREALGVSRGDAMLGFSPEAARQRLESIPWVAQAHVERHLPATIVVRLEERRPFAIWQNQGRFVIVDRQGKTVATDGLDQFGPLPLIVGPALIRPRPRCMIFWRQKLKWRNACRPWCAWAKGAGICACIAVPMYCFLKLRKPLPSSAWRNCSRKQSCWTAPLPRLICACPIGLWCAPIVKRPKHHQRARQRGGNADEPAYPLAHRL
jgi:hypothetical protein